MELLVGTSKGMFRVEKGATPIEVASLAGTSIRTLTRVNGAVLAGAKDGVYRSEDGGKRWTRTGAEDRFVWEFGVAPGNDRTVFAGTEPAALFRSDDGGQTWSEVESFRKVPGADRWCVPLTPPRPGRARTVALDGTDPNRLWVGVEVGGVVRTDDGGATWRVDLPGNNPDIHMLATDPARPGMLFATTGYGRLNGVAEMVEGNAGFFRSTDGGETWDYCWKGMLPRYTREMCVDPRAPHALTVVCAPTAFASHRDDGGAQAMLYRSDDAGSTWRSLCDEAHSPSPVNFYAVAPAPREAGDVLVGTDTGELWHVGASGTWTLLTSGLPPIQAIG